MDNPIAPIVGIDRHRLLRDGEGVTSLVAFCGCPLRCIYCLNPQCLSHGAATTYFNCQQLYDILKIDELYFLATNGGVAFGGGEPALQSDFIANFRSFCGEKWQITIETSLNVDHHHIATLLRVVDNYIIDIKDTNPKIYHNYTGQDNTQVLDNLKWLIYQGKAEQIIVRVPRISKFNTARDINRSIKLLTEMGVRNFDQFTYQTNIQKR